MRPTRPKPITPIPTRSLAPRTRFHDAAVRAAAVPALMKRRRVRPCGFPGSFEVVFILSCWHVSRNHRQLNMNTTSNEPGKPQGLTRRRFIKAGTAAALTAASWNRVLGANERVGIGVIGFGLVGRIHTRNFKAQPDAQVVAVAETYRPRMEAAVELVGGHVAQYRDFRKLLEDKNVDAVVVATPDHWHALMTMLACAAGKDVYVEKPLTLFVREGRWMIEVARRHKRVVQVGTQQRSGKHYQRARDLIRGGHIGRVVSVRLSAVRNIFPGFGKPPDQDPPAALDWDLWQGPAP